MESEPASGEAPTGLLVIVPRDQVARYVSLVKEVAGLPGCQVIVDRRVAQRRTVGQIAHGGTVDEILRGYPDLE